MRVYVNDQAINILPGMTVKHALTQAGLLAEVKSGKKAFDQWDNEIGLDGALSEGMRIYVK
ncbi:MAG: hypothetical protein NTY64_15375 [Deltaproteobacteria bacterium]|nr:hypothetical protein [Deltaproteobacteria bacterium]